MSQVDELREQAARAERLASPALDALTVQRLLAMSKEYRLKADQLENACAFSHAPKPALDN